MPWQWLNNGVKIMIYKTLFSKASLGLYTVLIYKTVDKHYEIVIRHEDGDYKLFVDEADYKLLVRCFREVI